MWYTVYSLETGRVVSTGTDLADPLPAGLGVIETDDEPVIGRWVALHRAYVPGEPEPAPDAGPEPAPSPDAHAPIEAAVTPVADAIRPADRSHKKRRR
jgi:hypothetical protein